MCEAIRRPKHIRIMGRTTWYETVAEMLKDLDAYLHLDIS